MTQQMTQHVPSQINLTCYSELLADCIAATPTTLLLDKSAEEAKMSSTLTPVCH